MTAAPAVELRFVIRRLLQDLDSTADLLDAQIEALLAELQLLEAEGIEVRRMMLAKRIVRAGVQLGTVQLG